MPKKKFPRTSKPTHEVRQFKDETNNLETKISQNIDITHLREIVNDIDSLQELENVKKYFSDRNIKVIRSNELMFAEDKKTGIDYPVDPEFKGINSKDLFVDNDNVSINEFFNEREQQLREEGALKSKRYSDDESTLTEGADIDLEIKTRRHIDELEARIYERNRDRDFPEGVTSMINPDSFIKDESNNNESPTESIDDSQSEPTPADEHEKETDTNVIATPAETLTTEPELETNTQSEVETEKQPDAGTKISESTGSSSAEANPIIENINNSKVEIPDLSSDSIANTKSLKELRILLTASDGVESKSQGQFSGTDMAFLVEKVSKGEAYIEEITREMGLREKVWNLILEETGSTPKSLEHEEVEAIKEDLHQAVEEHQSKTADTNHRSTNPHIAKYPSFTPNKVTDPRRKTIPYPPTQTRSNGVFGKIKKLFGFGK